MRVGAAVLWHSGWCCHFIRMGISSLSTLIPFLSFLIRALLRCVAEWPQALGGFCGRFIALLAKRSRFHLTPTSEGPSVKGGAKLLASHRLGVWSGSIGQLISHWAFFLLTLFLIVFIDPKGIIPHGRSGGNASTQIASRGMVLWRSALERNPLPTKVPLGGD
ncbi:unnamed protein product [Trypanosoma congolense IL3000]|uniref:WGS project CAEQ00000000 data, annotated contig 1119 n=1 Tax=Trypanosoma congolense (strain IL3000) TaxID=1068625 RepID=F9W3W7_TRYCI|nr:unnamed protein product [Trypanosoma congolense IL3000]